MMFISAIDQHCLGIDEKNSPCSRGTDVPVGETHSKQLNKHNVILKTPAG